MTLTVTLNGDKPHLAGSLAQKAAEEFASKHGLTGYQVVAIWQNSDDPLFDELDSAITNAAIEALGDRDDFDGYQIAPTD
jgi:hypothetical protein